MAIPSGLPKDRPPAVPILSSGAAPVARREIHAKLSPAEAEAAETQRILKQIADPERIAAMKTLAVRTLAQPPEVTTNLKQFAFLHCGAYLEKTKKEGGQMQETLPYWQHLLASWDQGKAQIVSPDIPPAEIQRLRRGFQDLADFDALIQAKAPAAEIQKLLKAKLESQKECYFPTGWTGVPGHFMVCKFRLENSQVIMELMTKGGGAEFHPLITTGPNRDKHDYRFFPVSAPVEVLFNSQTGKTFFERLMKFSRAPKGTVKDLDAQDLYALFLMTGKAMPRPDLTTTAVGVTSQRSGTCPDTGLHMLVYESNPARIRRNMYAVKFQSLVDGYRQFKQNLAANPEAAFYLKLAAREHLTRILKLYPEEITDHEFLLGYAIASEIEAHAARVLEVAEERRAVSTPDLGTGTSQVVAPGTNQGPLQWLSGEPLTAAVKHRDQAFPQVASSPVIRQAQDVIPALEKLIQEVEAISNGRKETKNQYDLFAQVQNVMRALPLTSGDLQDKFWDSLPKEQIPRCLTLLSQAAMLAQLHSGCPVNMKTREGSDSQELIYDIRSLQEIALRAFDIAAQIAPRVEALKLEGFGFQSPGNADYIMDPAAATAIGRINENFRKRNERAKDKLLFPTFLSVEELGKVPQGAYLQQFLDTHAKARLKARFGKWEAGAIEDPNKELYPPSYYDLQALAHLCRIRGPKAMREEIEEYLASKDMWKAVKYSSEGTNQYKLVKMHGNDDSAATAFHPKISHNPYGRKLNETNPLHEEPLSWPLKLAARYLDKKHDPELYFENGVYCTYPQLKVKREETVQIYKAGGDVKTTRESADKPPLPRDVLEEFTLFKTHPELQVTEALNWATDNLRMLDDPFVQGYLETVIFKTGSLPENLRHASGPLINRIQKFLLEGFNQNAGLPGQASTLLWLTRMGVALEGFIKKFAPENAAAGKVFPDYHAILQDLLSKTVDPDVRSQIFQHMLIAYDNHSTDALTTSDCLKLLSARMSAQMIDWHRDWQNPLVSLESVRAYSKHHAAIKKMLMGMDDAARSAFLNQLLSDITQQPAAFRWVIKGEFLCAAEQPYEIHLDSFTLFYNGESVRAIDKQITNKIEYRQIFGDIPFRGMLKNGMYYIQPEEEFRIRKPEPYDRSLRIQRKMTVNGKELWYEYIPYREAENERSGQNEKLVGGLPKPVTGEGMKCWLSLGGVFDPPHLVVTDQQNRFRYHYTEASGLRVADPLTGKPGDLKVMNLINPQAGSIEAKWMLFFRCTDKAENILVMQHVRPDGSSFVNRIEFPRLGGLSFTMDNVKGELRLRCDQDPDFYLAANQDIRALHRLKGPLLLEDADRKKHRVIMPALKFIYNDEFSTSYISLSPAEKLETGGKPYFLYDLDRERGILKPESPRAALYLAMVFRAQRDYESALEYLKQSYKYANDELIDLKLVNECLYEDKFPEACAFDCHLALRMQEHRFKHTRKKFHEKPDKEMLKIYETLGNHFQQQYDGYLGRMSDAKAGIGAVAQSLRLTPHQEHYFQHSRHSIKPGPRFELGPETRLAENFSAFFDHDHNPSAIASIQENLIRQEQEEKKEVGKPLLAAIDLKAIFQKSEAGDVLKGHFFEFCRLAATGSPEARAILKMDLYYLYRTPKELDSNSKELLRVLLSILQHPELYRSIKYPMPGNYVDRQTSQSIAAQIFKVFDANFVGDRAKKIDYEIQKLPSAAPAAARLTKADTVKGLYPQAGVPPFSLKVNPAMGSVVQMPLGHLAQEYIAGRKKTPLVQELFPLDRIGLASEPPLVKRQVADLKLGHEINTTKQTTLYTLGGDSRKLESDLRALAIQDEKQVSQIIKEVEHLANVTVAHRKNVLTDVQLQLHLDQLARQRSGQQPKLSLDVLIAHLMRKDTEGLLKLNPALTPGDIEVINNKLLELFVLAARNKQSLEALDLYGKIMTSENPREVQALEQQLASVLDRQRAYDPTLHPEYLVYEFASGMMLRKDQVDLLDWIFANFENPQIKNILFQFAAGGGKTKVLMPIMAFYLAGKGFLPTGLNISSLYEIGRGDLDKSLMKAFKQNLEVLEIELDTVVTVDDLKKIYADLQAYHQNKKCLAIKTETWHALKLKYQQALDMKNNEEVDLYFNILKYLRTKGVAMIDEGHQSLDPLHESNIAAGKPTPIGTRENKLVVALTNMLAGLQGNILVKMPTGEKKKIQEVVHLLENKQAMMTDQEIEAVRAALIEALLQDPIMEDVLRHPEIIKAAGSSDIKARAQLMLDYLRAPPSESKPDWLFKMRQRGSLGDIEMTSMLSLAKKFLYETCPHTLRLIQGINYGDSLHPNDLTAAPRHHKQPVTSKFQDIYVTLALTVQNTIQEGLDGEKLKHLMILLLKEHTIQKQAQGGSAVEPTKAQNLFDQWWGPGSEAPFLDRVRLDNKEQLDQIVQRIGRNPAVIQQYLLKCALPQIRVFHEKMTSTPPELLDGFFKNITFSATPGLLELYPVELTNPQAGKAAPGSQPPGIRLDYGFEPQVLEMLCRPHNRGVTTVSFDTLEQFFTDLEAKAPGLIKNICSIIDQGGIFRSFENPAVIEALLSYARKHDIPFAGGIYRKETKALMQNETGQLVLKQPEKAGDIALQGSDLREGLKLIGKNFDQLILTTFFDRAITTGADILQPLQGRGILTVGEGGTKTYALQAAMRLRKLLLGENGQSVQWVIEQELLKQIPHSGKELTVEEIFLWLIRNESVLMEKALVMRAFQGVQHILRRTAWREINAEGLTPDKRIELYQKFRKGMVDELMTDPYETFGKKMTLEDAEVVLNKFADSCAQKLGLLPDYRVKLVPQDREALKQIVDQTKDLVGKINQAGAEMSQEMHQQQESRQEVEQQALQEANQFISLYTTYQENYDHSCHDIYNKDFLTPGFLDKAKNQHQTLQKLLNLKFIYPDIIVSDPFLHVRNEFTQREFRPVKYILAVMENGKMQYLLCSRRGAHHYREQLKANKAGVPGRKVMLLDSDGKLVMNGAGAMGFSEAELASLDKSEGFKDRIMLIQLMNGKVKDVERLKRLARENWSREEYDTALRLIRSMHVGESPIDNETLEEIHKFKKAVVVPESVSDSLTTEGIIMRIIRYFFPVRREEAAPPPKPLQDRVRAQEK